MLLTQADASAVHHTGKLVASSARLLITDTELVNALFDNFSRCETDYGIQQCVAVIPKELWGRIEEKVTKTLRLTHPGELFVYAPFIPSEAELEALDRRVRHTMSVVSEYLRNPIGTVEYEIDDPDGMRQKWFLFKHFDTVPGEACRRTDCTRDRVDLSVFCPSHHFEMIYGQRPPDEPESNKERHC